MQLGKLSKIADWRFSPLTVELHEYRFSAWKYKGKLVRRYLVLNQRFICNLKRITFIVLSESSDISSFIVHLMRESYVIFQESIFVHWPH